MHATCSRYRSTRPTCSPAAPVCSVDCIIIGANAPTKIYNGKEIKTWPYWFNDKTNEKIIDNEVSTITECTKTYENYSNGEILTPVTKNWFYGWAGSLKLGLYDGDKLIHIGDLSGITDEIKQNWKQYLNTVVEISCMEIHDTGGLRHPKALNWLRDKNPKDCTMEQIR